MISHPFMTPSQPRDPPRHPLVVHDDTFVKPDLPQLLVAVAAMDEALIDAHANVEQPRHTVVKFILSCHCYSFYLNMH